MLHVLLLALQVPPLVSPPPPGDYPAIRPLRLPPTVSAPLIDGRLDDESWALVQPIDAFVQVDPAEGAPPSQRTEVRLAFDDRALYIGVSCFDSQSELIRGTRMARDVRLDPDDRIEILIDPFLPRRD